MENAIIKTEELRFAYTAAEGVAPVVLDGVDLEIEQGSFVAVLGHNGSGKSTLAKHMNAILLPSGGKVWVDGMDTADEEKLLDVRRTVGMVFQNPDNQIVASVVEEDVAFGPENLGVPSREIRQRVDAALQTVGMAEFARHAPHLLSGGQKQRVAIARALINRPRVLLLDEPLGALDLKLRKQMQLELKRLQRKLNITFIYVTHDQEEALTMSDRIAIMRDGVLEQVGTPLEIYENPATRFVATFIGETNLFEGYISSKKGEEMTVTVEPGMIRACGTGFREREMVAVSVRPERMKFSSVPVEGFTISGEIREQIYAGSVLKTIVVLPNGNEVRIERLSSEELPKSGRVYLYWNKGDEKLLHSLDDVFFDAVENVKMA